VFSQVEMLERTTRGKILLRLLVFLSSAAAALAQGNYEIQTYPSETQDPGHHDDRVA
jgi:hypothetical protein